MSPVTWGPVSANRNSQLAKVVTGHANLVPIDPGAGAVTFIARSPAMQVTCKLGDGPAVPDGGVGGWQDVERPGRADGLEWTSTPSRTLAVPILLDGLVEGRSIESVLSALELLGRPPAGAKRGTPPPILKLSGMVRHEGRDWVITGITQGDAKWDGKACIRFVGTVNLTAFVPLDLVVAAQKKTGSSAPTRVYTVKRGDTLGSIARDELGANTASSIASAVSALKKLNGIRDPKSIKAGDKLKLPAYQDTVHRKKAA